MKINIQTAPQGLSEIVVVPVAGGPSRETILAAVARQLPVTIESLRRDFQAEPGEMLALYGAGQRRYTLLGLGERPDFGEVLKAFRSFSHKQRQKLSSRLELSFRFDNAPPDLPRWIEAALNGLYLGTYQLGRFKTTASPLHPLRESEAELWVVLPDGADADAARQAAERGRFIAETQLDIFDLVNAPSNKKTPEDLADWARRSGERHGYAVQVLDKKEIERTGLHALLAVNQGSASPPVFIIMEYRPDLPPGAPLKKVGLVGKGVTFDTGGLSIKPSANMHLMKSDMGGAAAVFGAMEVAARLRLPVHLIGVVPATDNSVDALSFKPSDVIESYSGKTIEVIDTDAEGRLILADGLSFVAQQYRPDVLIDLATLTGSAVRTFGYHAAALFTNNDDLAGQLARAGQRSGERVWRLPLWDVYKDDVKSDVADVRNFSGKPVAGSISAAKFLEVFIFDHQAWAHLDIAGVAFNDSEFATQKSATAYGVRLLLDFIEGELMP